MAWIVLGTAICAALAGLLIKYVVDAKKLAAEITWREYAIGVAVITLIVAPAVGFASWKVAARQKMTYHEFWNGREVSAQKVALRCTRDGICRNTYQCDPYQVCRPVETCTGSGETRSCSTRQECHTEYHSCPYCNTEYDYFVTTTLGRYTIARNRLPENPHADRWEPRRRERLPERIIRRAGTGDPEFWSEADARIAAGSPGPATAIRTYENYILASETSLLKQWSGEVARLDPLGLVPDVRSRVYSHYLADKAYFVNWAPLDAKAWQDRLADMNAVFGHTLEGDLHLVVVDDRNAALNPDQYTFALRSYWQDSERLGREAFPKNAILIVLGTRDAERVAWARMATGMPLGNEALEVAVRGRLAGALLDPDSVLGAAGFETVVGEASVVHGEGAIERLVFGLEDPGTRFTRISMTGDDADDIGSGFLYLKGEIRPSPKAQKWIFAFTLATCMPIWGIMLAVGTRDIQGRRHMPFGQYRPYLNGRRTAFHVDGPGEEEQQEILRRILRSRRRW